MNALAAFAQRTLLVAAVAWVALVPFHAAGAKAHKPNIVFILCDDLGWGDLGCYGNARVKTPNLDRLARQGAMFTQFYSNGSVCSPSRVAFMTSHFPAREGVHGHFWTHERNQRRGMPDWLDPKVPNIAALLKSVGYVSAHYGKWHLGIGEGAPEPTAYGFDDARTMTSPKPNWEWADTFIARSTALFVDEALGFIRTNQDKPFFVNLWLLAPHAPLFPTEEQMAPYNHLSAGKGAKHKSAATIFYSVVADLDKHVGRLLKELDTLGLTDNTLILFSSDNGPEDIFLVESGHSGVGSTGPFRGRKRSLYEGGVRMPFIVRWPGHVPGNRVDKTSVVAAVDFLPTICKLVGIPLPNDDNLDGEDVSDILLGQSRTRKKPLLWEWRFAVFGGPVNSSPILAIRDGDWKLLFNPDHGRVELYNLPRDPTELDNTATEHPEIVERLAKTALDWSATLPKGPLDPTAGKLDYLWPVGPKDLPQRTSNRRKEEL